MNNRWKMNRMGFVNFWLYDEEIFSFADGKLFLRGANASGKSITTQSFIPFILDGDRSPNRLDPFGSNDRKMEYYFLGNGEKDDVTGYLFLEFKKENTEQYKTIGIGQRAQTGKPIGFWGFIILDGTRVGDGINLYQSVGSKKIPYSKQDLKKIIGENNIVVDSQVDYMELVNKHIFGFPRIEQYDQFIRLMIKVRAPKLSRDFKPTKVYEILNESLQTLSDEDLRAMVDAMEKMDDIQGKLDALRSAFKDLQSIRNVYDHYNRYMLSKKAHVYMEAKKQVNESKDKFDLFKDQLNDEQEGKDAKEYENEQLTANIEILEKEKEVLDSTDLENSVDRLNNSNSKKEKLDKELKDFEEKIENHKSQIRLYDINQREHKNSIEFYKDKVDKMIQELDEINEILQFEQHSLVKNVIGHGQIQNEFLDIKNALKEYSVSIEKGLKALKEAADIESLWSSLEEEVSLLNSNKRKCEEQLTIAETMETQCRDSIIESFYISSEKYKELVINKQELKIIVSSVMRYTGAKDLGETKKIVDRIYYEKTRNLLKIQVEKKKYRDDVYEQLKNAQEELNKLINMKETIPERREKVTKARKILFGKGINCLPFYEAVEFNDKLTEEEQSLLEEQLLDAGLLDALVVTSKDFQKAKSELKYLSDTLLRPNPNLHTGFNKLVAGELDAELLICVEQILDNIYTEYTENSELVLSNDGYFKNGIVEGHSIAESQASFVGTIARRQKMIQMVEEEKMECKRLQDNLYEGDLHLKDIQNSIDTLNEEYEQIPQFDDLDEAIGMVQEANYSLNKISEEVDKKRIELENIIKKKKIFDQNVITNCKGLSFKRIVEEFQEASDIANDYKDELIELESKITYLKNVESSYTYTQELIYKEENTIDDIDLQIRKVNQEIKVCNAEISKIQEFLNRPENKERAEKIRMITTELDEKKKKINDNEIQIGVLKSNISKKKEEIALLKSTIVSGIEREEKLRKYYEEELDLGFVMHRGSRRIDECVVEAIACIRDNDQMKSVGDVVASLLKTYQQHNSNLTSYGTSLEDCFEDDKENSNILRKRQCIVSTWQGKKLYLEEFFKVLKESIDSTELLIQEKDRELFENILADTLSHKLNNRIAESKNWIKDMSKLMYEMDTSMGLTFSLEWKARNADNETELDTQELEKLLNRDRKLLTTEDIEKVSTHFRSKIRLAKQVAEDNEDIINYSDLVRDALDYRKWFEFKMHFYRNGEPKKELTNSAFNKFSGGEKAMAMYVPLFAAVNAQYKKSENPDHPRLIALDEAFAGVDDKNISSMFELVQKLEFDYIMNSQALWGCYETVKSLSIAELLRPANSSVVTVIYYYWNGKVRTLVEQ